MEVFKYHVNSNSINMNRGEDSPFISSNNGYYNIYPEREKLGEELVRNTYAKRPCSDS